MSNIISKKTFLIVEWTKLPENIRNNIADNQSFSNDCFLPIYSEFDLSDYNNFEEQINSYWQDQLVGNHYVDKEKIATLENFITEYGLEFDVWLANYIKDNNIDITGVDEVLIKVCW
jgi:hypothetical protein